MTKELKELLHKGGECTVEDFKLLVKELPCEVETDLNSDDYAKYIGYRDRYWFYIHEVRGYCVINMPYILYESEYFLPDLEEKLQYLERKDEQEAYVLFFCDLCKQEFYSSYEKLENHFLISGGHQGSDLKKDPEFSRLYNKLYNEEPSNYESWNKLFEYRNYAIYCPERDEDIAVIWINEHEHCTMSAWYYLDEIRRTHLVCVYADITFYFDGVPMKSISYDSKTDDADEIDEELEDEMCFPFTDNLEDPFVW